MRNLLKAFGSCKESVSVPCSGRRSVSLTSQLADLCEFLTWQGAASDAYHGGFQGAEDGLAGAKLDPDKTRDPALVPYRSLDASRLKLSGTASWDPAPFLSGALWLAYVEPMSLRYRTCPGSSDVPDLSKEDYAAVLALAKVWDVRGLLWLEEDDPSYDLTSMRFFNCFKSAAVDRMIGDRRAMNAVEGIIPGASRALPSAFLLSSLEINPSTERLSICVSDRKDFYHQFMTTPERTKTNMCFPPLRQFDLLETKAMAQWVSRKKQKRSAKYVRDEHGDFLEQEERVKGGAVEDRSGMLRACFASVPQGDALGVEFAVDSHRSLMRRHNLITDSAEMRADRVFRGQKDACGLVIDDFYTISVVPASPSLDATSWSVQQMQKAQDLYAQQGLLGSSEKDVIDADHTKVTGAEIDASQSTRALGLCNWPLPGIKESPCLSSLFSLPS